MNNAPLPTTAPGGDDLPQPVDLGNASDLTGDSTADAAPMAPVAVRISEATLDAACAVNRHHAGRHAAQAVPLAAT